jgi:DNA mismatch repair ATPase MutS
LFFAGRPLVAEELSQGSQKAIDRINALNDLERLLSDNTSRAVSPKTFDALKEMLTTYLEYKKEKERSERFGGSSILMQNFKDRTIVKMRQLSQFNENTAAAYDSLFGSLLGD